MLRWSGSLALGLFRRGTQSLARTTLASQKDLDDKWVFKSSLEDVNIPNLPLTTYFYEKQEQFAGKTALVENETGRSFTHAEVRERSLRFASALARLDVAKGDTVALLSPNCPDFSIAFMGIVSLGAICVPVNCTLTPEEVASQLITSKSSVMVCHEALLPLAQPLCAKLGIRHLISQGRPQDGVMTLQKLIEDNKTLFHGSVKIDPEEDVAVMPFSSGTTGVPKGVMLTHRNLVANIEQIFQPIFSPIHKATGDYQEVLIGLMPFSHIYGMVACLSLSIVTGSKVVTLMRFNPETFLQTLVQQKITFLHAVPPILSFLTKHPSVTTDHLKSVHATICSAAPVGPVLIKQFQTKFPHITYLEGFGMTETSPCTHLTPINKHVPGSCGITLPNTIIKIVDVDTGETLQPQEKGELCVKGPQVMKGYINNEEATRQAIDEDGWLHTGDIAKIDEDGYTYIVDRLKELIKVKGMQVAPAELENLIRKHEKVLDVAVIGVPHSENGEAPRAYVVPEQGAEILPNEIENYISKKLAKHKWITGGVCTVKAIPRSATGKILRTVLKEKYNVE